MPQTWRSVLGFGFGRFLNYLSHQGLLDFSRDFDVALMDRIVTVFYTGAGQEVRQSVVLWAITNAIVECTAANGATDFDSVGGSSRCMDKSTRYPGAINLSPVKGAMIFLRRHFHFLCELTRVQYIGLQILEKLIITRWKTLPEGQQQGLFLSPTFVSSS